MVLVTLSGFFFFWALTLGIILYLDDERVISLAQKTIKVLSISAWMFLLSSFVTGLIGIILTGI